MNVEFALHGLLATGGVIIIGLIGGKLAAKLHIPKITGYLLIGVAIGPSGFEWISAHVVEEISVVTDIALGMLLFAIGGVFERHLFQKIGLNVLRLTLLVSSCCFSAVTLGLYALLGDLHFAATMGAICITTSPGAALLVTREYNSSGPLTETLILMVGISNVLSILMFEFIGSLGNAGIDGSALHSLTWLVAEIVGALIVGFAVGALLSWWESKVEDQAELILAFIAGILVITGLTKSLGLNPLLATLVTGAVTTNMSMMHRLIYVEMRQMEQPLYIAFFVISGAHLDIALLWSLGLAGLGYMGFSALGKIGGVLYFAGRLQMQEVIRKYIGPSLLAQGGVAIGLATTLQHTHPELAPMVSSVILGSVIVFEVIGPPAIRWSLVKAGETRE